MSLSKLWYLVAYLFIACVGVLIGQLGLGYQIVTLAVFHFIAIVTMLEFRAARTRSYARRLRRGTMKRVDAAATEACWMTLALIVSMAIAYGLLAPQRIPLGWFAVSPALYIASSLALSVRNRRRGTPATTPEPARFLRVPGTHL
ncbi:hypothetical protein JT358_07000 [Micrococcales bacterium 31B]|nr:hypothetical protein [Micrococcales bacterium 31B]